MSLWSALTTAWTVAREGRQALDAAQETLAAGGTPFAALEAFAAATDGQLDDEAVETLRHALGQAIRGLHGAALAAAWVAEHEDALRAGVGTVVDLGWRAGQLRVVLEQWLTSGGGGGGGGRQAHP